MTAIPVPAPTPASDSDVQDFANMSAALTGFLPSVLKPALDPVGLSGIYYHFAVAQVGQARMTALLDSYRAIQKQPPQTIADTLLETKVDKPKNPDQVGLAQSIVAMWYLGSWYPPGLVGKNGFGPPPVQVVSSEAYTNGLVWKAMQSHPMGYSPFVFGYWSQVPASLADFGVNTTGGGSK